MCLITFQNDQGGGGVEAVQMKDPPRDEEFESETDLKFVKIVFCLT